MSDQDESGEKTPAKRSKLSLVLGCVLALAGGGGSFFAIYTGAILRDSSGPESEGVAVPEESDAPDVAFVEVEPLVIGIGRGGAAQHLRFRAQLEVPNGAQNEVRALLPRVVDVMNTYLRAVEVSDLKDPAALVRLRAQLLRRVQVVVGMSRVHDLLVMEFVVS